MGNRVKKKRKYTLWEITMALEKAFEEHKFDPVIAETFLKSFIYYLKRDYEQE